jgi:AcrR family transcriptional regulator
MGAGATPSRHGHGGKSDEIDTDTERFFRVIDRAILERHSQPSGLPLMLAALTEYHAPFRKLSHNPFLMAEGLEINPDALSLEELRQQTWQKVEPLYLARLSGLVESYQSARSRQLGADDLADVAQAALAGRVATLLVEADRTIPGRIDPATGLIEEGDLSHPEIEDMLDDLAEMVLRTKGEVVVVPTTRMPSTTGLAATYRF